MLSTPFSWRTSLEQSCRASRSGMSVSSTESDEECEVRVWCVMDGPVCLTSTLVCVRDCFYKVHILIIL
eukprot:scaffold10847_cov17-Tisochrysis_lutea.AAC.2